jgi:hypothetical protein
MEQIMELNEYARKGNIMNIKENYYIYIFKQFKELVGTSHSHSDKQTPRSTDTA